MAFMDKVTNLAGKAVEQAGDAVEITKLKGKINSAEKDIISLKCDIADYYLSKGGLDEAVAELAAKVEEKLKEIADFEDKIAELKE